MIDIRNRGTTALPYEMKSNSTTQVQQDLKELESRYGGRLGLCAIDTESGVSFVQYNAENNFPVCSTAKVIVAAAILFKNIMDTDLLKKQINYSQKLCDASGYAPVTGRAEKIEQGMTVQELCEAAICYSDNTAMNLLVEELGGTESVNDFVRSVLGSDKFRLDRIEPDLNSAIPGDLRDTSTPQAMAEILKKLVFNEILDSGGRQQMQTWLKNNTTGAMRIRAGVPEGFIVGDKTGGGAYGTTNDMAVIWPGGDRSPIVLAIFFGRITEDEAKASPCNEIIQDVTKLVVREFEL